MRSRHLVDAADPIDPFQDAFSRSRRSGRQSAPRTCRLASGRLPRGRPPGARHLPRSGRGAHTSCGRFVQWFVRPSPGLTRSTMRSRRAPRAGGRDRAYEPREASIRSSDSGLGHRSRVARRARSLAWQSGRASALVNQVDDDVVRNESAGGHLERDRLPGAFRPTLRASRSMSPVEICGTPSFAQRRCAWVPLPAPGGPIKTRRMAPYAALRPRICAGRAPARALVVASNQMRLDLIDGIERDADDDHDRRSTKRERDLEVLPKYVGQHAHDRDV